MNLTEEQLSLNEVSLSIEERFQLLDTFSFNLQNEIMFSIRQCYKISWAVVIFNSIQVMNYPTWWQPLSISFFPIIQMLLDITYSICSRMLRHPEVSIAFLFESPPLKVVFMRGALFAVNSCLVARLTTFSAWMSTCQFIETFLSGLFLSLGGHANTFKSDTTC